MAEQVTGARAAAPAFAEGEVLGGRLWMLLLTRMNQKL